MKYALLSSGVILITIGLSVLIVILINKKKKLKAWLNIIVATFSSILLSIPFLLIYFAFHYNATEDAKSFLKSDESVVVRDKNGWYEFDNTSNTDDAIIFYGGAKVEESAYAPLCHKLAEEGVDVFLIKMPLYFPLLNSNAADQVLQQYTYQNYYMMGHSLGGTTASLYLSKTNYSFKGIIFLASYSTTKLDDSYQCLSLYGTQDTVLKKEEYSKNQKNFPKDYKEVIIEGGNHSQFGNYGQQRNDSIATIERSKQIEITTNEICSLIHS